MISTAEGRSPRDVKTTSIVRSRSLPNYLPARVNEHAGGDCHDDGRRAYADAIGYASVKAMAASSNFPIQYLTPRA